jgi:biotin carboxyl carrier protein
MRTEWRDGARSRSVEVETLGQGRYRVSVDGVAVECAAALLDGGRLALETPAGHYVAEVTASGQRRFVRLGTLEFVLDLEPGGRKRARAQAGGALEAPMPGVVTRVMVKPGDRVEAGQPMLALEAMKMEHVIRAPRAGAIRTVLAAAGEMVAGGATLVELEPDGAANA